TERGKLKKVTEGHTPQRIGDRQKIALNVVGGLSCVPVFERVRTIASDSDNGSAEGIYDDASRSVPVAAIGRCHVPVRASGVVVCIVGIGFPRRRRVI